MLAQEFLASNDTLHTEDLKAELEFQQHALQGVSRTFALTIPCLSVPLRHAVGNAYLLCRIADTIEDDRAMSAKRKRWFSEQFVAVIEARHSPEVFARALGKELSPETPAAEQELIAEVPTVIRLTHSFAPTERRALARCVGIMAAGMAHYQERETLAGLEDIDEMARYCYHVAGVVGEMLTELFCAHIPELAKHRKTMMCLAVSFGQGLQMTNILKDIWEDRGRGACWLPRDLFAEQGVAVVRLEEYRTSAGYACAMGRLLGVARGHLQHALDYTLMIPKSERGVRRFCLWALGMAVLTLKKIDQQRAFTSGNDVKISRRAVKMTVLAVDCCQHSNGLLRAIFFLAARSLPKVDFCETIPRSGKSLVLEKALSRSESVPRSGASQQEPENS